MGCIEYYTNKTVLKRLQALAMGWSDNDGIMRYEIVLPPSCCSKQFWKTGVNWPLFRVTRIAQQNALNVFDREDQFVELEIEDDYRVFTGKSIQDLKPTATSPTSSNPQPLELDASTTEYHLVPSPGRYFFTGLFSTNSPMFSEKAPVWYPSVNLNGTEFEEKVRLLNGEFRKMWNPSMLWFFYINIIVGITGITMVSATSRQPFRLIGIILSCLYVVLIGIMTYLNMTRYANLTTKLNAMVSDLNLEGKSLEEGHGVVVCFEVREEALKGPILLLRKSVLAPLSTFS
ncbi:hypothetical protein HDU76_008033 [Blyttiomyces sp. JEL0837]|nr:hypothetical protein HDU76_008033 [Blyttiomyces sp. JEL0837]